MSPSMIVMANTEHTRLDAGLAAIGPLFKTRGFTLARDHGAGHGAYATATFRLGRLEVGLIVRSGGELGCPNYSEGAGYLGHEDLVRALGYGGRERLMAVGSESLAFRDREGGDAFDALRSDLEGIVLPALDASAQGFRASLARALEFLREDRGW